MTVLPPDRPLLAVSRQSPHFRRFDGLSRPKEEREWLVGSEPEKFSFPRESDLRFNWVHVRLDKLDLEEMRELVFDAWRMVVPKRVAAEYERRSSSGG